MKTKKCMKELCVVLCLLVMVAVCSSAFGSSAIFKPLVDNKWSTPGNWLIDYDHWAGPPSSDQDVYVSTMYWPLPTVVLDAPAVGLTLKVGSDGDGTLELQRMGREIR